MADDPRPRRGPKKIRVELKRNRGKVARDKRTWTRGLQQNDIETQDAALDESLSGKGDISRKRTVMVSGDGDTPDAATALPSGRIVSLHGLVATVENETGRWACTIRRMVRSRATQERQALAVGDVVRFRTTASGESREGVIEHVEPRLRALTRQYEDRVQIIAANVDQALIVASTDDPPLRPHLIDRFLVAAHKGDLRPVICINKMDLSTDETAAEVIERYRAIGYKAIAACASRGEGVEDLRESLRGQTTVVVGVSGVGKSTLMNAVDPGLKLRIGEISEATRRGRHTTTNAVLLPLSLGGYVVDTPGIRQFDLGEIPASELEAYFIEFVPLIANCRFPGCTHLNEEQCAVLAALEAGTIHPERYDSYSRMMSGRLDAERGRWNK